MPAGSISGDYALYGQTPDQSNAQRLQGKRTKILASQHVGKESVVARCSELFLLDTHFGFLAL
jgi:hypothetical protein